MHKPIVLVVDDSVTMRTVIERTLQREAFALAFADDGLSALTAVAELSPVVILLDVHLPHMNGYTICQLLRKKALYRDIPIVMLTSKNRMVDRMYGRLTGATEYLTKPFDPEVLAHVVQKQVAHWQQRLPLYHQEVQPRTVRYWKFSVPQERMLSPYYGVARGFRQAQGLVPPP
jgi:CheY-like chemotaxis protein